MKSFYWKSALAGLALSSLSVAGVAQDYPPGVRAGPRGVRAAAGAAAPRDMVAPGIRREARYLPAGEDSQNTTAVDPAAEIDSEIAMQIALANAAEVQLAQLATERAQNDSVRGFAQQMVKEHSALLTQLNQLQPQAVASNMTLNVRANRYGAANGAQNGETDGSTSAAAGDGGDAGGDRSVLDRSDRTRRTDAEGDFRNAEARLNGAQTTTGGSLSGASRTGPGRVGNSTDVGGASTTGGTAGSRAGTATAGGASGSPATAGTTGRGGVSGTTTGSSGAGSPNGTRTGTGSAGTANLGAEGGSGSVGTSGPGGTAGGSAAGGTAGSNGASGGVSGLGNGGINGGSSTSGGASGGAGGLGNGAIGSGGASGGGGGVSGGSTGGGASGGGGGASGGASGGGASGGGGGGGGSGGSVAIQPKAYFVFYQGGSADENEDAVVPNRRTTGDTEDEGTTINDPRNFTLNPNSRESETRAKPNSKSRRNDPDIAAPTSSRPSAQRTPSGALADPRAVEAMTERRIRTEMSSRETRQGSTHAQLQREIAQQCLTSMHRELSQKEGAEFDRAYMASQVAAHMKMMATLKVARRHAGPELAQLIDETMDATEEHLDEAKRIALQLDRQPAAAKAPAKASETTDTAAEKSF